MWRVKAVTAGKRAPKEGRWVPNAAPDPRGTTWPWADVPPRLEAFTEGGKPALFWKRQAFKPPAQPLRS